MIDSCNLEYKNTNMSINGDLSQCGLPSMRELVKNAQNRRTAPIQDIYIRKAEEQLMKWNPSISSHKGTISAIEGTHPLQVDILNNDENFRASTMDRFQRENTTQWYKENSNNFEDLIKEGSVRVTKANLNPETIRSQPIDEIFNQQTGEEEFEISSSAHTELTLSTLPSEHESESHPLVNNDEGSNDNPEVISNNDSFQLTINAPNTCTTPYGEIVHSSNLDYLGGSNPMLLEPQDRQPIKKNNSTRVEPIYKSLYEQYYRQPVPVNYLESLPNGVSEFTLGSSNSFQREQRRANAISATIKRWYAVCLTSMSCDQ